MTSNRSRVSTSFRHGTRWPCLFFIGYPVCKTVCVSEDAMPRLAPVAGRAIFRVHHPPLRIECFDRDGALEEHIVRAEDDAIMVEQEIGRGPSPIRFTIGGPAPAWQAPMCNAIHISCALLRPSRGAFPHRHRLREARHERRHLALMVRPRVVVDHHGAHVFVPAELLHLGDIAAGLPAGGADDARRLTKTRGGKYRTLGT